MEKGDEIIESISDDKSSVEYISFANLLPFDRAEVESKIENSIKCIEDPDSNWVDIFNSFNTLRSIIRFNLDLLLERVCMLNPHVLRNVISIRSNIAKVALQYLSDLFLFEKAQILEVVVGLLPTLLLVHSQKGKRFLIDQTEVAITNLITTFSSTRVSSVLIKLMSSKNVDLSSYAYKAIDSHIKLHLINYSELKASKIESLVKGILIVFKSNKEPFTKMAISTIKKLSDGSSREEFKFAIGNLKSDKSISFDLTKMLTLAKAL